MELLKELVELKEGKVYNFKSKDGSRTAKKTYDAGRGLYTVKFFKDGKSAGKDFVSDGNETTDEIATAYVDKDEKYVDKFIKNLAVDVKKHLETLKEAAGDWSTEEHAIAAAIEEKLEKIASKETAGDVKSITTQDDLRKGIVNFEIDDAETGDAIYKGTITVKIDWKKPIKKQRWKK